MTKAEKKNACYKTFLEMAEELTGYYDLIGSCNNDGSVYLIPKKTLDQLSYYEKPINSFRVSSHWNWYASLSRCSNPKYIQCYSVDMPFVRKREEEGAATKPRYGFQVAFYGPDKKYHCVYGEVFDRKTRTWSWKEATVDDILWQCLGFVK